MTTVSITEAREDFARLFNRVAFGHERIVIDRRGKDKVALIPADEMEMLDRFEDEMDIQTIRDRQGEPTESWDKVKHELGLDE